MLIDSLPCLPPSLHEPAGLADLISQTPKNVVPKIIYKIEGSNHGTSPLEISLVSNGVFLPSRPLGKVCSQSTFLSIILTDL